MAQVTELVTKFSFAGSLSPLTSFNQGMGSAINVTNLLRVAMFALPAVFTAWSSSMLQSLDPLAQLEKRTDVAIGRIQELSFVASQSGSDANALQSSILSLSQTIGDAAYRGNEDFSRLGISVRDSTGQIKTADVVLEEMRGRFKELNLSMMQQESIASSLGIDASLVQMLNRTDAEMASLTARARELGTLNSEQADQIIAYNDALNQQRYAVNAVKQSIAIGFAPALTRLAENFTTLVANNREWITDVAAKTIEVGLEIGDAFMNIGGMILDFADAVSLGHGEMTILIGVLASAAAAFPVTAAIAGLVLVVEDLLTAFDGGESVIADFFEDNFGVDIVQKIKDFNALISDTVGAVKFLTGNTDYTPAAINPAVAQQLSEIPVGNNAPGQFQFGNGGVTIQQQNTFDIRTNDPAAAGTAVANSLQDQLQDTEAQFSLGGAR